MNENLPKAGAALNSCGLFTERVTANDFTGQPALFLDRDGVIVEETNYLHRPEDVQMIAGVPEAIASINRLGVPVVLVTNQAGIGRGYYDWAEFDAVQRLICSELEKFGARLDWVAACAYHPEGIGEYAVRDHAWRKPGPGMLLEAASQLGIDLASSHIIGDCLSDIQAGANAGLRSGAMVQTGHGKREWKINGPQAFDALEKEFGFSPSLFSCASIAIKKWLTLITS